MERDEFPTGVAEQLKWYVYRLIDPRNGETFYVGKGQRNRLFEHAKGALSSAEDEDESDLKTQRIQAIRASGLDVGHLVHRHGLESESMAYEVEAALIDAYPGLTNQVLGHGSGLHGCRHVEEVIQQYGAEPFKVTEPLILITIKSSFDQGRNTYDAVRWAWKVSWSWPIIEVLLLAPIGPISGWRRLPKISLDGRMCQAAMVSTGRKRRVESGIGTWGKGYLTSIEGKIPSGIATHCSLGSSGALLAFPDDLSAY